MYQDIQRASLGEPMAQRQTQIPQAIALNGEALAKVQKTVSLLHDRLTGVLMPNGPKIAGDSKHEVPPTPTRAPFAGQLTEQAIDLMAVDERLRDILERLEV
jgi:hypothetical protein